MELYRKVIFVSDADTCLAPMAAEIMKNGPLKDELDVESRGLVVLFPEPVNEKAEAVMISNGIHLSGHKATLLQEEDFAEDTLVLAVTKKQYVNTVDKFGDRENLYSLSSFLGADRDIEDPYGKSLKEYGQCFEMLQTFIRELERLLVYTEEAQK